MYHLSHKFNFRSVKSVFRQQNPLIFLYNESTKIILDLGSHFFRKNQTYLQPGRGENGFSSASFEVFDEKLISPANFPVGPVISDVIF